jgi:putative hydrolase of the HAD superfamily
MHCGTMPLRALIFDFDGLIIDTESAIYQSWRELYASHGHELTVERWSQCVGTDFSSVYDPKTELETLTDRTFDWVDVDRALFDRVATLLTGFDALPGVRDRLAEARELGLPCSVASSSPLSWVSKHLDHLDLRGHFMNVSCRDHVERIKPHPDLFLDAAKKLGAAPDEVIIFEDSLNGLKAARAAGMRCVVVPGPTTQHLDFTGAWHHLESLDSTSVAKLASIFR